LPYVDSDVWRGLPAVVGEAYRAWARPVGLIIVAMTGIYLPLSVTAAALFFKKRTSAPLMFNVMNWGVSLYGILTVAALAAAGLSDWKELRTVPRDLIVVSAWTAYMLNSKRVRSTFVRRLRAPEARDREPAPGSPPSTAMVN
jgi:hypothetical protein